MRIDLTQIIIALIGLLGTILTAYGIPFIKQKTNELKEKTNEATYNTIMSICQTAVYFVEQWYKTCGGEEKKQHAIEHVQAVLEDRNMTVDIALISDYIESEVLKMKIALGSGGTDGE